MQPLHASLPLAAQASYPIRRRRGVKRLPVGARTNGGRVARHVRLGRRTTKRAGRSEKSPSPCMQPQSQQASPISEQHGAAPDRSKSPQAIRKAHAVHEHGQVAATRASAAKRRRHLRSDSGPAECRDGVRRERRISAPRASDRSLVRPARGSCRRDALPSSHSAAANRHRVDARVAPAATPLPHPASVRATAQPNGRAPKLSVSASALSRACGWAVGKEGPV
ncbi:hypothetical protein PCL_05693 [Purpureocillium lilacinum]|uniref:Uncharacterized protein n=1 Tax=Purpureocillium lilacinum TaxID=33203 RepID=A0A2U3EKJ7_PURLI|nr:hypothetical protein PCL_05693 [Purpureocillium lilacinum]